MEMIHALRRKDFKDMMCHNLSISV